MFSVESLNKIKKINLLFSRKKKNILDSYYNANCKLWMITTFQGPVLLLYYAKCTLHITVPNKNMSFLSVSELFTDEKSPYFTAFITASQFCGEMGNNMKCDTL